MKHLPEEARSAMPEASGSGPARLRNLIVHHYFSLDVEIIWEIATTYVPRMLVQARRLRHHAGGNNSGMDDPE